MAQYLFHQLLCPKTYEVFHFVLLLLSNCRILSLILTAVLQDVVSHEEVEPPPPPAADTEDETLEVCKPEEECHPVAESTKVC